MSFSRCLIRAALAAALCVAAPSIPQAGGDFLFTGKVTDGAGKPVADAEIFIYDSAAIRRPADFITPRTGSDGVFRIRLPQGKYWTVARVRKGDKFGPLMPGDRHSGEPAEVDPENNPEVALDFTVADIREAAQSRKKTREDYSRLTGRILDPDGKPVAGAYVFAVEGTSRVEIPAYISSWTDQRGEYVLFVPQGKYVVRGALQFPPEPKTEGTVAVPVEVVKKETALDLVVMGTDDAPEASGHDLDDD